MKSSVILKSEFLNLNSVCDFRSYKISNKVFFVAIYIAVIRYVLILGNRVFQDLSSLIPDNKIRNMILTIILIRLV